MIAQDIVSTIALVLLLASAVAADVYDKEVKCFCDKTACPGSLVCTGRWCLIGLRTEDGPGRLDQTCGWEDDERPPTNCAEGWGKWTEVCACTEHLCNTFAFLRSNMDRRQEQLLEESRGRPRVEGSVNSNRTWYQNDNQVVLLLIIPLGVGGFLVCLIFLNFHCKMS